MSETINQLAFKYFNGTISGPEEQTLFRLIQNEDGRDAFRKAEQQWLESPEASHQSDAQWSSLRRRIDVFKSVNNTPKPVKPRRANPWLFTTIAACFAIAVMGFFLVKPSATSSLAFESPAGARSKVTLPDNSTVWLNSDSKLTFDSNFGKKNRVVELSGEGYFEVVHNEKSPFLVHAGQCDITVLGTRFNVSSYEKDNVIRTSVSEGKVSMSNGIHAVTITRGQEVSYAKNTATFTKKNVSISSIAAWTENRMEYADITLRDFADIISRNYNVKIIFQSDKCANEHLSISLRNNETLEDVLEGIRRVLPVSIVRSNNTIYFQ